MFGNIVRLATVHTGVWPNNADDIIIKLLYSLAHAPDAGAGRLSVFVNNIRHCSSEFRTAQLGYF